MNPPSAFGTFRVLHQIGSGVLGPVFRAYDSDRERLVAIKAFKLDLIPEKADELAEALRTIASTPIPHPAVVAAVAAGLETGRPYLALEYVSGDGLDVALRQFGRPTPSDALTLCRSLAEAVDAAWDAGLGHGTLHPRDVFLLSGSGEVSVSGFGVARALDRIGIKSPVRRPYAAPERVSGGAWDRRSDLYSVVAISREVFDACGPGVLTRPLESVWHRGLAEDPDDRYPTGASLVEALIEATGQAAPVESSKFKVQSPEFEGQSSAPALEISTPVIPTPDVPVAALAEHHYDLSDESEEDLPLEPVPPTTMELAAPEPRARFPWAATIAVAVAGIGIGSVIGYRIGLARGANNAIAQEIAPVDTRPAETPAPVAVQTEPVVPDPPASTPAPRIAPKLTRPVVATVGGLDVDSRPRGARVTVDGRALGQTPVRVPGLSPGDHRVLIELVGHRRIASTVKVVAGEQTRLAVTLEQTELRVAGGGRDK